MSDEKDSDRSGSDRSILERVLGAFTDVKSGEGLPVLLVKDIPPVSVAAEISITRPEIYYGKLSSNYVIVNTKSKEFDYPAGEDNVFTEYAGAGGVKIDSLLRKLAFTAHFASMKLLLSNDVTAASRVCRKRASFGSVAASPPATPLVVPMRPP